MKKYIVLIMLMLCCINIFAQQTTMTVDNQMPGWLSSKISYSDQLSLKNLTVTGYINGRDIEFIQNLMQNENKSLVHIDLTDATIVAGEGSKDNIVHYNYFFSKDRVGTFLALPRTAKRIDDIYKDSSGSTYPADKVVIDTLVIGGPSCNKYSLTRERKYIAHYLYLREGIDSIICNKAIAKKVHLPSTLKYIKSLAFLSIKGDNYFEPGEIEVEFPNSIEIMDPCAFKLLYIKNDTVKLPSKMKTWYTCSFLIKNEGSVIYIPESISLIDNKTTYEQDSQLRSDKILELYMESQNPPEIISSVNPLAELI